jgi:hypothetical protein
VFHRDARLTVHGRMLIVERQRLGWKQAHIAGGLPADIRQQRRPRRRPCTMDRELQHCPQPQPTPRQAPDQPSATNVVAGYT